MLLHHLIGREAQRLVLELHAYRAKLLVPVHTHADHHAARVRPRLHGAGDFIAVDRPPLPAGPPVLIELLETVAPVALGMLLPILIVHPGGVTALIVLRLQLREEMFGAPLLRPIPVEPEQGSEQ